MLIIGCILGLDEEFLMTSRIICLSLTSVFGWFICVTVLAEGRHVRIDDSERKAAYDRISGWCSPF